ncbi:protoporphyrinogen oxidase [Halosimplex litoreum]|uniref:Protoporphyrinogen oxidase n=1 Tax=Halosimplex litoreum TaxID=1198301 RepID=A0A7T3FXU8_9EURY|nr:flavodoxin domain-containing protein [Halosimplex litoreum]QPV62718.1 protoporphyrinogen oxidase [Halosimplex litoreum]
MGSFLVCYGSSEGQTAKIADRIAARLRDRDHEATAVDAGALETDYPLGGFDAVVVGSSIHVGSHQASVRSFVEANAEALAALPTAFFQVSLSSVADDPEWRAEAARYVEEFLEDTGFQPDRIARFGGALRYSKYGFLKRLVMKRSAREATGDTDTSRDYEYTDWAEVEGFTDDFAAFVERRVATGSNEPT